jgi:hypothetical protein
MGFGETLVVGLLGGLAGSIFTVTVQYLRDWLIQPSLRVTADPNVGGCVVNTPFFEVNSYETLQSDHAITMVPKAVQVGDQRYLRLRIDNDGRSTARNVCVSITKITRRIPGSGQDSFDEEVMDLMYPFGERSTSADIPPKTHRFINLCHTSKRMDGSQEFAFDVAFEPARIKNIYGKSAAEFQIELMIAADNVMGGRARTVSVRYGGTFDTLNFGG